MPDTKLKPEDWVCPKPEGLYIAPGGFYIDPVRPVDKAVITHGHGDHARPGHRQMLATAETLAICQSRFPTDGVATQALPYRQPLQIGDVTLRLVPAGHILGSAQVVLEHHGQRVVVSGDYKRRADPTCAPYEPVNCDVFITEATFALPVFRHPPDGEEVGKLLDSLRRNPDHSHLVGVYALGKCQRLIALLRQRGYDRPIYLHGALSALCRLYEKLGVSLGPLVPVADVPPATLTGQIVMCPPSALADRWSRRMGEPITAMASGWMRVKQRAKQRGVELPLIISDHADWDELLQTLDDVGAPDVWVTHGREEALVHVARQKGIRARALSIAGYEDEA